MKIDLKLGSVSAKEFATMSGSLFVSHSENATSLEITRITNELAEITKNTLFIIDEANSLAEMMAVAKKGALCVLCTDAPEKLDKIPETAVLVCDKIKSAVENFAKQYAKRGKHRTIAITGLKGKTRTGEFVYSVLEEMYKVHKATDKKSNVRDDALALFELTPDTDFLLVELKIHEKRDIKRLANLIDCDAGIITEIQSKITETANIDVLAGLRSGGELAFSAEDDMVSMICRTDVKNSTVSVKNSNATLHAERIRNYKERTVFDIRGEGVLIDNVEIHFSGVENVYSALFAAQIGLRYGVPIEKIRTGLKNYHASELGVEICTVGGVTFIADSSSATVDSMRSGIDTLCEIAKLHKRSRKIALLGDIRDFGQDTRALHEKMGEYVVEKKIDKLFTFGVAAEQIGVGARRAGMRDADVFGNLEIFSPQKSAQAVAETLREGDVFLIRIGRANAAAEIIQYLHSQLEQK